MRIVIAEDDPFHRAFLRSALIDTLPDPLEIEEAGDGARAVELARQRPTDALVLDLQMPKMSGAEAARIIWADDPNVKILFWTNYSDEAYVRGVSKIVPANTVYGYVLKSSPEERTKFAMRAIFLEDQCIVDREVWGVQQRSTSRIEGLTDLEYEVLIDIALGLTDRGISVRRNLSTRGVQSRLRHLYQKLGLDVLAAGQEGNADFYNLRARAVYCAIARRLLNPDLMGSEDRKFKDWQDSLRK
ncbi:response regulator transcription factor [Propionivibrio soli]|uniref:response regulator transcription factor n=1 Tax=Propionivibrio soli TaxID=2976531 RepID=UPI0021E7009C|nr:response regulator transcription factor [Propionivibrio soli]